MKLLVFEYGQFKHVKREKMIEQHRRHDAFGILGTVEMSEVVILQLMFL